MNYTNPYTIALQYLHSKYKTITVGTNMVKGTYTSTTKVLTYQVKRELIDGVHGERDKQIYLLISQYYLGKQPKIELKKLIKNLIN